MIIVRTPYRISFFGGGTDYPEWYKQHGGAVLGTTIDKYCYTQVRKRTPWDGHKYRLIYREVETAQYASLLKHPLIKNAILKYADPDMPLEVHHDSDLPARSGMGSSSAFAVGLVHALDFHQRDYLHTTPPSILAYNATELERTYCAETVGDQDQIFAAYGGFRFIEWQRDGIYTANNFQFHRMFDLQQHLLLFYLNKQRVASTVAKTYDLKNPALDLIQRSVDRAMTILDSFKPLTQFGVLMDEAWDNKRKLSNKVSTPEIDLYYREMKSRGATGGKLLGAGGGGFMLFFVEPQHQQQLINFSSTLGFRHVPFKFSTEGSKVLYNAID